MRISVTVRSLMMTLLAVTFMHSWCLAGDTLTVTDLVKRTVTVPRDPERIICVAPGALRLICYLGVQDKLVGVELYEKKRPMGRPYRYANPGVAELPTIGPGGPKSINHDPDLEAVLKVRPDVIVISYMKAHKADALQKKLNIPVVVVSYGRIGGFDPELYESLKVLGKIFGKEERATEVVQFIEGAREDLIGRVRDVADSGKPLVYVGGIGFRGSQGIESTDAGYTPLSWVKARNVATSSQKTYHLFIDKEKLLSWDPDVIFIDAGGMKLVQEDCRKKPTFYKGLKAFENKSVFLLLPFNWYTTNIGTAVADAYACGKTLYPQKFSDVDLPKKADEIYTFLVGKPVYKQMQKAFGSLGSHVSF